MKVMKVPIIIMIFLNNIPFISSFSHMFRWFSHWYSHIFHWFSTSYPHDIPENSPVLSQWKKGKTWGNHGKTFDIPIYSHFFHWFSISIFPCFSMKKKVSPPGRIGLRRRHGFGRILLNHLLHHLVALENHGKAMGKLWKHHNLSSISLWESSFIIFYNLSL